MSKTPPRRAWIDWDDQYCSAYSEEEVRELGVRPGTEYMLVEGETRCLIEMEAALRGLTDAVANMRVPQSTTEAGLLIEVTIGPALERARAVLDDGDSAEVARTRATIADSLLLHWTDAGEAWVDVWSEGRIISVVPLSSDEVQAQAEQWQRLCEERGPDAGAIRRMDYTDPRLISLTETAWRAYDQSNRPAPFNRMRDAIQAVLSALAAPTVQEALEFYADPDTYFAIGFLGDSPCGEFMNDSETEGEFAGRPGAKARAALRALSEATNTNEGEV